MTGIVVTGHGHFAEGIMSAVRLVAGAPEQIREVNFEAEEGIEDLKSHMVQAISELESENVLVLVDVMGGSPFNVASQLLVEGTGKNLKVVTGTNLAAVLQAVFLRESVSFEELAAEAVQAGKEGLVDVTALLEQNV